MSHRNRRFDGSSFAMERLHRKTKERFLPNILNCILTIHHQLLMKHRGTNRGERKRERDGLIQYNSKYLAKMLLLLYKTVSPKQNNFNEIKYCIKWSRRPFYAATGYKSDCLICPATAAANTLSLLLLLSWNGTIHSCHHAISSLSLLPNFDWHAWHP